MTDVTMQYLRTCALIALILCILAVVIVLAPITAAPAAAPALLVVFAVTVLCAGVLIR